MYRLILDERGKAWSSRDLARWVEELEQSGRRDVAVILGGADGHTPEFRGEANILWSLSPLTLQHELALVVVLEQLYRAYTLRAGLPYHRD
jgi:23S rRNA (pseudouridine1915-N3)-methyltransferase